MTTTEKKALVVNLKTDFSPKHNRANSHSHYAQITAIAVATFVLLWKRLKKTWRLVVCCGAFQSKKALFNIIILFYFLRQESF